MEELDLKEVWNMFWAKKAVVFLIVLIFIAVGTIYTLWFTVPKYTSSTTLILTTSNKGLTGQIEDPNIVPNVESITTTDITLNSKLVSTYSELVKSDNVLNNVIANLDIDIQAEQIRKNVKVDTVKETEMIKIAVTNENPIYSAQIANEIAKVFAEKVNEFYNINNVHVVDPAKVSATPSNINHIRDIIIFAAIGIVVSIVYVLVLNMLDTTVKSAEDVEKLLNIPVLVSIPLCDFDKNKKEQGGNAQ